MLLQAIMMTTTDGEDQDYDVCEDGIAMIKIIWTFSSKHEYEIVYECDFQISNQSLIPRPLGPSCCLPADKETLETRLV